MSKGTESTAPLSVHDPKPGRAGDHREYSTAVWVSSASTQENSSDRLRSVMVFMGFLLLLLFPTSSPAQIKSFAADSYGITLGDAVVLPGTDETLVPVLITSEVEIDSWQMGLEYDELLLNLVSVDLTGTASESLTPLVITSTNSTGAIQGLQVIYTGSAPFPAGNNVLAAYLRFSPNPGVPFFPGSSVTIPITIVDLETLPISMTDTLGNIIIPISQSGSITVHEYPLYLLEDVSSDLITEVISIPMRAWSEKSSSTFTMGLEYDELLLTQFTIDGSDFDALSSGLSTVNITATDTGILIELISSNALPALDGQTLGFLQVIRPVGGATTRDLNFDPDSCTLGGDNVTSLESGSATWLPHFVRGDTNLDGSIDIADAETLLGATYSGEALSCQDAGDVNDDGVLDISDTVSILQYLFSGSPNPLSPFPDPGPDPTSDGLTCQ